MIAMSIAGVDPSGGAGVFADLKTFQALGVYGTGVVTALTAQNPYKMFSLKSIDSKYVAEQIDAVLDSYEIEYIKNLIVPAINHQYVNNGITKKTASVKYIIPIIVNIFEINISKGLIGKGNIYSKSFE